MGATGWMYFTPYQPDIQAALDALRQQVFEKGDYYFLEMSEDGLDENFLEMILRGAPEGMRDSIRDSIAAEVSRSGVTRAWSKCGLRIKSTTHINPNQVSAREVLTIL